MMAFRMQAFQRRSIAQKSSFVGSERSPSQLGSIGEDNYGVMLSGKIVDKLLTAMRCGDEGEAEQIQRRCEEIETCISDIETRIYACHKSEMARWTQYLSHIKDNYESELTRRQEEVKSLNGALSTWVTRFLELQSTLRPGDHIRCRSTGEDVLRILERTQQIAAESLREKGRLSAEGLSLGAENIQRHSGDFGDVGFFDDDET